MISTNWHELAAPFQHYLTHTKFDVAGYVLILGSDGFPVSAEPYRGRHEGPAPPLLDEQLVFLFSSRQRREQATKELFSILDALGIKNFYIVETDVISSLLMNYAHPYSQTVVFSLGSTAERQTIAKQNRSLGLLKKSYQALEVSLLQKVCDRYRKFYDDLEIMYPAKFSEIISRRTVAVGLRAGFYTAEHLHPADMLIKSLKVGGSNNASSLELVVTKRLTRNTENAIKQMIDFFVDANNWGKTIPALVRQLVEDFPDLDIYLQAFVPSDFILQLISYSQIREAGCFASLSLCSSDDEHSVLYAGIIVWDKTINLLEEEFFAVISSASDINITGVEDLLLAGTIRAFASSSEQIMESLGLSYCVFDLLTVDDVAETIESVKFVNRALVRTIEPLSVTSSLFEFVSTRIDLLDGIANMSTFRK